MISGVANFPENVKKMHKLFRSFVAYACDSAETEEIDLVFFFFSAYVKSIFGNRTEIQKEKLTNKNKPMCLVWLQEWV